jgi:hypothetical protein
MATVLLHVVGAHPGGIALDYAVLAVLGACLVAACAFILRADHASAVPSARSARRAGPVATVAERRSLAPIALSLLGLSVLLIQGFHVIEHIIVVVQVEALGMPVARAQGLAGAQIDFEWLHFGYNASFLAPIALLLAYGVRSGGARGATVMLAGALALQSYHVGEHLVRVVQYVNTGCTPCVGLIGQVVLFIWPHLLFGLLGYAAFAYAYFAYGMHRRLIPRRTRREQVDGAPPAPPALAPQPRILVVAPALLEPPAPPAFLVRERSF